jgi:hypothetical protein
MKTQLFHPVGSEQDGDRPEKRAPERAKGRHALALKPLSRRPNSKSGSGGGRTPPRHLGLGPQVSGVVDYQSRLVGPPKEKSKKTDVALSAMAAQLLDLDPILTAAVILGGEDD